MNRNYSIWFIACAVVIHLCHIMAADLGHMSIQVNKLNRKHNALQLEVDELWATIIRSGIQKNDNGIKTQVDDNDRNAQELFTKVNDKLAEMEGLKKEIENLIMYSRAGLENEKVWQREAMGILANQWENLRISVKDEFENLKQTIRDALDTHDQQLRKMQTENLELITIIAEFKNDNKKMQENHDQQLSKMQAENQELRNIIAAVQNDNQKMLQNIEANNAALKDVIHERQNDNIQMKQETNVCDEGWEEFNGHCYLHRTKGEIWDAAAAFCESKNSYLVEITTDTEMDFINEFMRKENVQYGKWVGATYREDQGAFVYKQSNTRVPENFWRKGQLDSSDGEHCAAMYDNTANGTGIIEFFDYSCKGKFNAVCEKP